MRYTLGFIEGVSRQGGKSLSAFRRLRFFHAGALVALRECRQNCSLAFAVARGRGRLDCGCCTTAALKSQDLWRVPLCVDTSIEVYPYMLTKQSRRTPMC